MRFIQNESHFFTCVLPVLTFLVTRDLIFFEFKKLCAISRDNEKKWISNTSFILITRVEKIIMDMEGIWVFRPWSNSFFWCCGSLFLNGTLGMEIWHVGRNAMFVFWRQELLNEVCMRDHDPWFIPYGYGMDDWVVFWCTMLVVEPKEKLFTILFKVV